jgi:hypothetical protein
MLDPEGISKHMELVFFFYGLAFFTLGVTVLAQPRRENSTDLVRSMWLLGGFGILHGVCEWVYLLDLLAGATEQTRPVHLLLSGGSFLFLFEFGRRLLRLALLSRADTERFIRWLEAPYPYALVLVAVAGHLATPGPVATSLTTWLRYTVAFPGSLFAAAGFLILARSGQGETGSAVRGTFGSLAYILLAYGLLSLVAAPLPFFPASVINTHTFRELFDLPVQIPRTAVAWVAAVAIGSLFHLFHRAARHELRSALNEANRLRQHSEMILATTDDAICGVERIPPPGNCWAALPSTFWGGRSASSGFRRRKMIRPRRTGRISPVRCRTGPTGSTFSGRTVPGFRWSTPVHRVMKTGN